MTQITASICDMEYEAFRGDNVFKKHPDGKEIFVKWRLEKWRSVQGRGQYSNYSDVALSKFFNVSPETFKNQRRRLNKKLSRLKENINSGRLNKDMKNKHIKSVKNTVSRLKKFDKMPGKKNGKSEYSLMSHIEDELVLIGGPETEEWMEILLYVSKYLFVNELSTYRTMVNRLRKQLDIKEERLYSEIADKKAGRIRDMIHDYIGQWGTLHAQAITETIDEQDQKINRLAGIVVESAPNKMLEVVEILDGKMPSLDSDAIISEIMGDMEAEVIEEVPLVISPDIIEPTIEPKPITKPDEDIIEDIIEEDIRL